MPATTRWATVLLALTVCSPCFSQEKPLYLNPDASTEKRVEDLLSRLTLEEKVSQMMSDSAPIERLGIPAYNWWNECLHGVARNGRATVFPEAIGLAATWDTSLMFRVSTAISDEGRAKYNEAIRRGKHNIYQGITFWTPNINIFRDPRWGRGMETYGEDPYLTGRMAVAFIKGLQGDDPKYLKTIATAKHYAVHSGPESERHTFDVKVDERDLRDTYLPQFEAAVKEGGARSVMCAYNAVDGLPACASPMLLQDILREKWGFNGYVVSDCGAVGDIYLNHKLVPTAPEGVAKAIKAGTDLNCGVEYENLLPAVRRGLIAESEIDKSLRRLLRARFQLGMFDPPEMVKYAQIPYSVNDSPEHRQLALETARKAIVLLKNDNRTLPLSKSLKTVAVIGPNADDIDVLLGNYNGIPTAPITPLAGIRAKLGRSRVLYARGSDLAANMPTFAVIPAASLFTSKGEDRKNGLNAEYFNSYNFDGTQHRPRELTYPSSGKMAGVIPQGEVRPLFKRVDSEVNFQWWDGSPRAGLNDDDFGVRWTGYISAPVSGKYQIGATGMNAFELYFEGKKLVEFNGIHEASYQYAPVELESGKLYQVRLDYHEYANDASIQLVWAPPSSKNLQEEAIADAKQADAVIMVLGLSPRLEGEEMKVPVEGFQGGDRLTLGIPRAQEDLLKTIAALNKPTVLVLMNGSAVAVNWAKDHIPAIVEAWYPGQAGGTAIADVLFGDYNPAGRLPVTFYKSADQLPPFTDYNMKGRTYRYFDGEPLFPFGYGLSYTTFSYSHLSMPKAAKVSDPITVSVDVQNSGAMAGEEVVQLYLRTNGKEDPIRSLAGFQRVALKPAERKTVQFTIEPKQTRAGDIEIFVGGKQPGSNSEEILSGRVMLDELQRH
ncbi:MAG: glycoside hydrolase family 3 C-terminal domain-containing protein [Bryobacteraceae bacterium]